MNLYPDNDETFYNELADLMINEINNMNKTDNTMDTTNNTISKEAFEILKNPISIEVENENGVGVAEEGTFCGSTVLLDGDDFGVMIFR